MIIQMLPLFRKGTILTEEMLEAVKQYALDYVNLVTDGYSDGIVKGCELDVRDGILTIGRGIVRFENQTYMIPSELHMEFQPVKQESAVKILFRDETRTKNFLYREAEIIFSDTLAKRNAEIEVCRFKLQEGAKLRRDYQNYADYITEFDTVNVVHADWASYGGKTISPEVLRAFVNEAGNVPLTEAVDVAFCQQVLGLKGETMNREALCFYIRNRLGKCEENCSNLELYQQLGKILELIKQKPKEKDAQPVRRQRFVIS